MEPTTILIILLVTNVAVGVVTAPIGARVAARIRNEVEHGKPLLIFGFLMGLVTTGLWFYFAAVTDQWLIAAYFGAQFLLNRAVTVAAGQRAEAKR